MADLIDRHALIKEISKYHITSGITAQATWNECVDIIIEELESFPSAHVGDLISKQAVMKKFSDFVRKSNNSDFAPTPTWNNAVSLVESMPSAQPKGHWIGSYCPYRCSECGKTNESRDNFCWNCGSDMRE